MKKLFAPLVVLAMTASAPLAQDWSGGYGVLGFSSVAGEEQDYFAGVAGSSRGMDGQLTSLALGYNAQQGNWVFGGELAYSSGEVTFDGLPTTNFLDRMVDLKGRVGYATGKTLLYATVGWAQSDRYFSGAVTNEPVDADGMSFGFGIDVMLTDKVFAGLEVQQRNLKIKEGSMGGFPLEAYDDTARSVGLRIGFTF